MSQIVNGHTLLSPVPLPYQGTLSILYGVGTPNSSTDPGVLGAAVGSLYLRFDGATSTTLYVREKFTAYIQGVASTDWVAK